MGKYCNDECKKTGGVCDFCKNYIDKQMLFNLETFQGEGICKVKNIYVMAYDGCDDNFICFNIKD